MKKTTCYVNGRKYDSLEQVPAELRALLAKAGPPGTAATAAGTVETVTSRRYIFNGREYRSIEEMPPEARALLEDKDGDGIPDIVNRALPGGGLSVNFKTDFRIENRKPKSAPASIAPSASPSPPAAAPTRPQRQYRKQERPDRPGFWARLFGKKD